jgi:SET domain-containing protein
MSPLHGSRPPRKAPGASAILEVRASPIAGQGAFAVKPIRKGKRIIEYLGERITPEEADRRYEGDHSRYPRVVLFSVDDKTVIDAGVGGNDAQFLNHSCEPNAEAVIERRRIWIYAKRSIRAGEEITYDYSLTGDTEDPKEQRKRYPCHCGSRHCRGTMFKTNGRSSPKDGKAHSLR